MNQRITKGKAFGTSQECFNEQTLTFEAEDTFVALRNRTENFGQSGVLKVSSNKERTLLKFNNILTGILEKGKNVQVISAKISLNVFGFVDSSTMGWENPDLSIHELNHNFCEKKVTWDCRDFNHNDCCTPWRLLPLSPNVEADFKQEPSDEIKVGNYLTGTVEFDVTGDVQRLVDSRVFSKSWMLKKKCEKDFGEISFWSCESQFCPTLTVEFKTQCEVPSTDPCN